jgi:hypothetical protein
MIQVITLLLLIIAVGSLGYLLGTIKGENKYFDKYIQEKHYSQELCLKCREKISKEDFEEIKDFHISHLKKI